MSEPRTHSLTVRDQVITAVDGFSATGIKFERCHIVLKSEHQTDWVDCDFDSCTFNIDGKDYDTDGFLALIMAVPTMTMTATP